MNDLPVHQNERIIDKYKKKKKSHINWGAWMMKVACVSANKNKTTHTKEKYVNCNYVIYKQSQATSKNWLNNPSPMQILS